MSPSFYHIGSPQSPPHHERAIVTGASRSLLPPQANTALGRSNLAGTGPSSGD